MKRIVHNHHILLRRTQGIVRQSVCIPIYTASFREAESLSTARAGLAVLVAS